MSAAKSPPVPRPWVIFLADRRELGGAVKVVSRRGLHTTHRPDLARRFATKADAREWLSKVSKGHRIKARFCPVIERL